MAIRVITRPEEIKKEVDRNSKYQPLFDALEQSLQKPDTAVRVDAEDYRRAPLRAAVANWASKRKLHLSFYSRKDHYLILLSPRTEEVKRVLGIRK